MVESQRPLCHEHDCIERAEVLASRSSRSQAFPVCDRHAQLEALRAERNGYPLLLTGLHSRHSQPPADRPWPVYVC